MVTFQENINTLVTETNTLKAEFTAKEVEKKDDEDEKEGNSASPNIADTDLYKPST